MPKKSTIPDFDHRAEEILKYHHAVGIFTMMLTNGNIVHHQPYDVEAFQKWLKHYNIPDLEHS